MGRPKSRPNAPRFEKADVSEAREALAKLVEDGDATTGQYSVENCAMMLKFWTGLMLDAERRMRESTGQARLQAVADLRIASDQAGEWEKRKAGAMSSCKVDLMKRVLARLDEQEKLADELLDIEE